MVSRDAVLAKAQGWVGTMEEGYNLIEFSRDWGIPGSAWCFAFVQSCFWYADPDATLTHSASKLPHAAMGCPYGVQWARDAGQSIEPDYGGTPIPGDIVFFTWGGGYGRWTPGTGDHVGIVEGWDGADTIYTIEGNVGPAEGVSDPQGVHRRVRSIATSQVINFWRPTVYDDDSLGPAALPPEEDMTPEQAALQQEIRNYAGGAFEQARAANTRLDQLRQMVEALGQQLASLPGLVAEAIPAGGGSGTAEPVDVEAIIRDATPEQLAKVDPAKFYAALGLVFGQQPKPPVVRPNDPA